MWSMLNELTDFDIKVLCVIKCEWHGDRQELRLCMFFGSIL